MSKSYTGGLNFTAPTKGDTNWDMVMDAVFTAISAHTHNGSGTGVMLSGVQNAVTLGVKNDGSVDVAPAINNIIAGFGTSGNSFGRLLYFPQGTYKLSSPVRLNRQVILFGDGSNGKGATFVPDKNVTAFIVDSPASSTDGGNGGGSVIENIAVKYASQTTTNWIALHAYNVGDTVRGTTNLNQTCVFVCSTAGSSGGAEPAWGSTTEGSTVNDGSAVWTATVIAGIRLRYPTHVKACMVYGAPGSGFHVYGATGGTPNTNVNSSFLQFCESDSNALNGVYVDGTDANACNFQATKSQGNGYWGFYDNCSVGSNCYIGCLTDGNTKGAYAGVQVAAPNLYVSCYSEGNQPASRILHPSIVVGGQHGAGFTSDADGTRLISTHLDGQITYSRSVTDATGTYFQTNAYSSTPFTWGNSGYLWSMLSNDPGFAGYDTFKYNNADATTALGFSNSTMPRGAGYPFAMRGMLFPNSVDTNRCVLTFANAQPSSGTWYKGDVVINSVPTGTGSAFGWRCTTGGTPGTWVTITTT